MSDTHILIAGGARPSQYSYPRHRGLVIADFPNWGEAIAGWEYADAQDKPEGTTWYAVRSADDPQWKDAPRARGGFGGAGSGRGEEPRNPEEALWRIGRRAEGVGREWRQKEIGRITLDLMRSHPNDSFGRLEQQLTKALENAGLPFSKHDPTDMLKRRMLVGRCWDCDRAWWLTKSQGPLNKARCHVCGGRLHQTTLALRKTFHRLPLAEVTA